jgi:hypothetical protein
MPQEPRRPRTSQHRALEHSNAIVLGSVLAKLELPLDSIDWHLEGDNGFGLRVRSVEDGERLRVAIKLPPLVVGAGDMANEDGLSR